MDLRELNLPVYEPGRPLEEYGPEVERFVEAVREADALLLSTAAYHGTLAGVTKNALDFAQFLARDDKPYLQDKVVGLVATADGYLWPGPTRSPRWRTPYTPCAPPWRR